MFDWTVSFRDLVNASYLTVIDGSVKGRGAYRFTTTDALKFLLETKRSFNVLHWSSKKFSIHVLYAQGKDINTCRFIHITY